MTPPYERGKPRHDGGPLGQGGQRSSNTNSDKVTPTWAQPRPSAVVVGTVTERLVIVFCEACGAQHRHPVSVGAYTGDCGTVYRVVLQLGGAS